MALCCLILTVHTVSAQQSMWMVSKNGVLRGVRPVSSTAFAVFNLDRNWFDVSITNEAVGYKTTTSVSASCVVSLSVSNEIKSHPFTPQIGVCYSEVNIQPTVDDQCLSLGSEMKNYSFKLSSLTSGTTYYYRVYVKLADLVYYGDVVSTKTLDKKLVDNSRTINGHKFVDLDLPSGLLWAETNIGATGAADAGDYFAWGETEPKSYYSADTYWYGTNSDNFTKYNNTDGKTVLEPEDDAAYVNWGTPCRMPTHDELSELCNTDNCTWTWTSKTNSSGDSINGYEITSVNNGNSIFLSASGSRCGVSEPLDYNIQGIYLSSTLWTVECAGARGLSFTKNGSTTGYFPNRICGFNIRPIAEL